jgi:CRP-like cAMP-binding protein
MRVHGEDLGTVANTVASNYRSHVCSPCVVGHVCWRTSPRELHAYCVRDLASCEQVELRFADVVCKLGNRICHVYFPTESVISLVTVLDGNARLELGMVGDEGMLGTSLTLGVSHSPQHAVVQGAGAALRMSAATFGRHYREDAELRRLLSRYVNVLTSQLAQTAACACYHLVEARLARWLLMNRDRAHRSEFHLTHACLAYMLGVRRAGVTHAASSLQARALIRYGRGALTILDNAGLEQASCACYREGNAMYAQTLGLPQAASRR